MRDGALGVTCKVNSTCYLPQQKEVSWHCEEDHPKTGP